MTYLRKLAVFFWCAKLCFGALSANNVWEMRTGATASNVNGGCFNPANPGMLTDLTTDTNTGNTNSPVVSSASYNFVAGDVNAWLYVKSGTNWTPGWYQIASVASNKATLSAAIGAAIQPVVTSSRMYGLSTVAGVATVGTPTNGTFTIDYTQQNAAVYNQTDLSTDATGTTLTSATAGFTPVMVGNCLHVTAGTNWNTGWYEILTYVGTTQVTIDRDSSTTGSPTGGTFYAGGAMSMNSTLDDDVFEVLLAGNIVYIKSGTFSFGENISVGTWNGTAASPVRVIGYNSTRPDTPTGSSRPTFGSGNTNLIVGSNAGAHVYWFNIIVSGSTTSNFVVGNNAILINCKIVNTAVAGSGRPALSIDAFVTGNIFIYNSEFISYRGPGLSINTNQNAYVEGSNFHDSDTGIKNSNGGVLILVHNLFTTMVTTAVDTNGGTATFWATGNTLYGMENKAAGTGFKLSTTSNISMLHNNIIYGFTTGLSLASTQLTHVYDHNNFYNNTTDRSTALPGASDTTLDPQFTSAAQVTGTTGKFAASNDRLIDTSKNFTTSGVVAGRDYLYVVSGTGATAEFAAISSITTTTNPNDTLVVDVAVGTNTTADKTYRITTGNNFGVGANMAAIGYPGAFPPGNTTGYLDLGAAQRQASGSGGTRINGGVQ